MKLPTYKQVRPYLKIALVLMVLIVMFLGVLLVRQYQHLRQLNYFANRGSWVSGLHAPRQPAGANNVGTIQTWMTFDYIDHLFALPIQYLQTSLSITDSRYPHMTISEYAEKIGLTNTVALNNVQNAVSAYFSHE